MIEEIFHLTNKYTGKFSGLLVCKSGADGEPKEVQLMPLNGWMIDAAEYLVEFVERVEVCPDTRRRFAPVVVNDRGAA